MAVAVALAVLLALAVMHGWKAGAGSLEGKGKDIPYLQGSWFRKQSKLRCA